MSSLRTPLAWHRPQFRLPAILPLALGLFAPVATAQSFNVDVGDDLGTPSAAYAGAANRPGTWNVSADSTAPPYDVLGLVDVDGVSTSVDLVRSAVTCTGCTGKNNAPNAGTTGDDELLMDDFQDLGVFGSDTTWTFSGLAPGRYWLTTYAWAPDGPAFFTTVEPTGSGDPVVVGGAWPGQHEEGVTYALHRIDVDGSGTFSVDVTTASAFGTLNGFQLIQQEPLGTNFCFGDGGDQMGCTPCRCGNEAPIGTMGGCLNANGGSGELRASGVPSVANDTMRFEVEDASVSTFGILISGSVAAPQMGMCPSGSGTLAGPPLDGLRCVAAAVLRHGTRATDTNGDIGVGGNNGWGPPSNPTQGLIAANSFSSGQTRFFQCFYREDVLLGCMTGQNTTNAVEVTFVP